MKTITYKKEIQQFEKIEKKKLVFVFVFVGAHD